jgi:hypothetical protein
MHERDQKPEDHFDREDPNLGVDGRRFLKSKLRKDVDWIHQAQNKDHWQTLANTVIN